MSRLARLPTPISRWLGYRPTTPLKQPEHIVLLWSWIGAFCGISLIQSVFGQVHYFIERGVPGIVPSYGSIAVLVYGTIEAPFSQPRALFSGHFLGALIGICVTKLFHLIWKEERFEDLAWLAGSLSCASTVVLMQITEITHPPAGATAFLASINLEIRQMGWYYLPVVLLSSTLSLVVALIINNIHATHPIRKKRLDCVALRERYTTNSCHGRVPFR